MPYSPIENYALIGNMHTAALVGKNGSIDFMCHPHFDSPTIFAALLDDKKGGRFLIRPMLEQVRQRQLYVPDTAVLLTRFLSEEGVAELSDFMPMGEGIDSHALIRRAKTVRGEVRYEIRCEPRFNYARDTHQVEIQDGEVLFKSDSMALRLRTEVPLNVTDDGAVFGEFTLGTGQTAAFVLEKVGRSSPSSSPSFIPESFKQTLDYWRDWVGRIHYQGRWREMVHRSAITLKLLTSADYGSVVAAPTFGLPEEIGGERNWDYRYTWIRDASFTVYALMRLGCVDEAGAFMHWVEDRVSELNPDGSLQIMYGIDGRKDLTEHTLPHLEGYKGSSPVRIGNGAYDQFQLDIYGELMDSVYLYNKYGEPIHHDLWENLSRLTNWVVENWQRPDEGIWEVRGGQQEFSYSRLMAWVAIDRAIRLALKRSFPAPLDEWHAARNAIYRDIYANFWDADRGTFVQHKGTNAVDASTLLMPLVRFISPTDPRWLSTMRAIEQDLVDDSLVYRYKPEEAAADGLMGMEGTFGITSFWYVEALGRTGDVDKARFIFEKLLGYANHVELYAEELGPHGEHLGNFPQAFTHLALISAAFDLDRRLSGAGRGG
ncbi:MAG: glycoside hydrolase family 15 protein [Anaerolineales bacterium]